MPDIIISPQRGTSNNPSVQFVGLSAVNNLTPSGSSIRLEVLPEGQVAFIGSAGSLFSITDSLTGSLMAVSDQSGLPILEVFSTDRVVAGKYNTNAFVVSGNNVGIRKNPDTFNHTLDVNGFVNTTRGYYLSGSPVSIQGTTGTQGATGATGSQGTTGSQGVFGAQGTTGATGAQGTQGIKGATGGTGAQGTTGATGAQGTAGSNGGTGAQGATGATGAQGTQGIKGATGGTGAQGTTGATGAQGTQGIKGATGGTGAQGATGATGAQGTAGSNGGTGSQGTTGTSGFSGISGYSGVKGSQGTTGNTGSQGTTGTTFTGTTNKVAKFTSSTTLGDSFITSSTVSSLNYVDVDSNVRFASAGAAFIVSTAGDVTGVSFTSTSSRRYKTNIRPLGGNLAKVLQLAPVRYDSTVRDDPDDIGMIAEDVLNVLPEVVYDDQLAPGEVVGIDYGRLTAVLVGAVQEMRTEYLQLSAQCVALQNQVAELSGRL